MQDVETAVGKDNTLTMLLGTLDNAVDLCEALDMGIRTALVQF